MFLEQQISILEWFLKDHVTLKTGVTMLKNKCSLGEHKGLLKGALKKILLCCFSFLVAKCEPQKQQGRADAQVRPACGDLSWTSCATFSWSTNHKLHLYCMCLFVCRFVRRLLYFYKPSSKLYSALELDHAKARQLTVAGCQFNQFLLDSEDVRNEDLWAFVKWLHKRHSSNLTWLMFFQFL